MIGTTIAHYRIEEKIGEGGMGEVYRARDTKLNRDVALKILPQIFAQDSQRMARFEREAQVLASLNHSHIAQIHGLEETEGTKALVLELVEGETLAEQISRGPIPVDEALKIALQIAEGLEAAHEKGVIHRDLKPANIKITPEGEVKILDFGLAKALEGETPVSDLSHSPTITHAATEAGVILGTASYMSPEQARGKPVDKRTDIWAFGCVLYEMLTGKKAFEGGTVSDVMASVLAREPDWNLLPENLEPLIRSALRRCLQKEAKARLHDIADARIEINESIQEPWISSIATKGPTKKSTVLPWIIAAITLVVAAVFVALWVLKDEKPPKRLSVQTDIRLPPEAPVAPSGIMPFGIGQPLLSLSHDGRHLVYVGLVEGQTLLNLRNMTDGEISPIEGTEGAHTPFFSPDGLWIGFFSKKKLKKVPLSGGKPSMVTSVSSSTHGATWGLDDWIYFNGNESQGIWRVSSTDGSTEKLTEVDSEFFHGWPEVLPDNKGVLLGLCDWWGIVAARENYDATEGLFLEGASRPKYSPTGHLVYATKGRLVAVGFDSQELKITGTPVVLFDNLRTEDTGAAQYAFSSTGTLVFVSGDHQSRGDFIWLERDGTKAEVGLPNRNYGVFKLSPDGRYLAFTVSEGWQHDMYLYDFRTGVETALATGGRNCLFPIWSPDATSLTYAHFTRHVWEIWSQPIDGSWDAIRLASACEGAFYTSDTELVVVNIADRWISAITIEELGDGISAGEPQKIKDGQYGFAALSPDGHWLAYTDISGFDDESKGWEIFLSPYPALDRRIQISTGGGEEPRWNPNGKEIIYRSVSGGTPREDGDQWGTQWFSVNVEFEPELRASSPKVLFEGPYINVSGYSWDISPDGERFLLIENAEHQSEPVTELVVISNFFDLLREKVPTE